MVPEKKSSSEEEKLLDHHYDGIQELDNPLPRWWVWLFYLTILFGFVYFLYYTFFGPTLVQELEKDLAKNSPVKGEDQFADLEMVIKKPEVIQTGKGVYDKNCVSCHNTVGQGMIGPNLTDDYWIHGKGKPQDILKVVVEGVSSKGMLAWGKQLKPEELKAVVAYVVSLRGTNPSNPKEPQGEKVLP